MGFQRVVYASKFLPLVGTSIQRERWLLGRHRQVWEHPDDPIIELNPRTSGHGEGDRVISSPMVRAAPHRHQGRHWVRSTRVSGGQP
jgi:hypothetical protein